MNIYYLTVIFEGGRYMKVNEKANCQSDAITQALNKLSDRDFDRVEKVEAVADKGNIENWGE